MIQMGVRYKNIIDAELFFQRQLRCDGSRIYQDAFFKKETTHIEMRQL